MHFKAVESRCKWRLALVGMASIWLVIASMVCAAAGAQEENTYIEFIFDSSLSMRDRISTGQSRMEVAKEVLRDVIGSLEDQPGLQIALRVYGSKTIDEYACQDSELLQPFGRVNDVRASILQIVEALQPRGRTPIGLSLQLAAKDFPMNPDDRNIIVLITDGQESCGIDPCQVSLELQEKGIIMKPYVVGFAMSAAEEASVRCIGEYYSASDRDSLTEALRSILVKVIAPPTLEIQAYGGGQNVLDRARIEILDLAGNKVLDEKPGAVQTMRVSLGEGVYTIKGYLSVGPDTVTAQVSGVTLVPGETTSVKLDFGPLTGGLRVIARASAKDVSGQVLVEVSQAGRAVPVTWTGMPPTATLAAGEYLVKVTHNDYPSLSSQQTVRISPGKGTSVAFDLGELPAQLEVTAVAMGRDITDQCQLAVVRGGRVSQQFGTGSSVFRYQGDPGQVDLQLVHVGDVRTEKLVSGTVLSGGETTKIVIDLSNKLGIIRAKVVAGADDVTADSIVHLDGEKAKLDLPQRGAYKEALVPAGFYGAQAFGRTGFESNTAEIDVVAGETMTVTLKLNVPGTLVLKPAADGRPVAIEKVSASAQLGKESVATFAVIAGRLTVTVEPGTYDIVCAYPSVPQQTRTVAGVSVDAGMTKEVPVDFGPIGTLDVTVIAGSAPLDSVGILIYQGETELALMSATGRPGRFQSEVVAGEYDLYAVPSIDAYRDQWAKGVQVPAGGQVQKQITLDAATRIRINAVMDGKPTSEVMFYLYPAGQADRYISLQESQRQAGTFEEYIDSGTYDLLVSPTISGFKDRWIRGLKVPEGGTLERRVQIGGAGTLRALVRIDGKPTDQAQLYLHEPGESGTYHHVLYNKDRGYYEIEIAEGTWDLEVVPEVAGAKTNWVEGIEIWGGEVAEKDISLGGKGTLRVTVLTNGKPDPEVAVYALRQSNHADYHYVSSVEGSPGVFAIELAEDVYDIKVEPWLGSIPVKWAEGIEIRGGEVVTKEISLGGKGTLRVTVLTNGKPDPEVAVYALRQSNHADYHYVSSVEGSPGVFAIELGEGVWDIKIEPWTYSIPEKWVEGIEVVAGKTVTQQISIGGAGELVVRLMYQGQPYGGIDVAAENPETGDYWWLEQIGEGIYSVELGEGAYDIAVHTDIEGVGTQYFRNIEVVGGQKIQKTLTIAGPGTLRVRLMGDGEIYSYAYVYLEDEYGWVADLDWDEAGKFFSAAVAAGTYVLKIEPYYDYEPMTYKGVQIREGEVLQRAVNLKPSN